MNTGRENLEEFDRHERRGSPRVVLVTEAPLQRPLAGDQIVTAQLLEALNDFADVLCVTLRPGEWRLQGRSDPANRTLSVSGRTGLWGMLTDARAVMRSRPLIYERYRCADLDKLTGWLHAFEPEVVILDHLRCGWIAAEGCLADYPVIYVAHNAEHVAYASSAKLDARPWMRKVLNIQAAVTRQLECRVLYGANRAIVLTEEDGARLKLLRADIPVDVISPWFLNESGTSSANEDSIFLRSVEEGVVLLVGSYLWHAKRRNARWLMQDIWPSVRRSHPGARLEIVGRAATRLTRFVEPAMGISLHADIPSLTEYFRRAAVFVNPERQSSGIKLKTLEAASFGLPIVSTSAGVEGTGLKDRVSCLTADGPTEFAEAIRTLLSDPTLAAELGANARFAMFGRDKSSFMFRLKRAVLDAMAPASNR